MFETFRLNRVGMGLVVSVLLMGCQEDTIREVRVPRERAGLDAPQFQVPGTAPTAPTGVGSGMGAMSGANPGDRLLIAMIDRPSATYFLRIQAASAAIDQIRPAFDQIVESLTFANDGLQWKLPAGWTESEGGAMFRIATLKSPAGIEVFVTQLTPGQEVLANVNRWQGQLGLPPVTEENMPIQRLQVGSQPVIVYDASSLKTDRAADSPGGRSGVTPGPNPPSNPVGSAPAAENSPNDMPFRFPDLGPEWKTLPASLVAAARWENQSEQGNLKLEVFKFPTEASFSSMLGIWGERLGAATPSEEALAEILQPVTIAGWTGEIVQWPASLAAGHATESPGQEAPAKSMRIARVAAGAHAWYFKLEGPAARVSESAESFREFLLNTTRQ